MSIDAHDLHFDDLLVLVAASLFFSQLIALRWGLNLQRQMPVHAPGRILLRILLRVATVNAITQGLTTFNALLLTIDPIATVDLRVLTFLLIEMVLVVTVIWSMWKVRQLY